MKRTSLADGWTFKQGNLTSSHSYAEANSVPTEVHRDLLKHGRIPDPFNDLDALSVQWVGDECWTYRKQFDAPSKHGEPDTKTVIRFEGLDTFAHIYLNGKKALISDNMFVEHCLDVTNQLREKDNVLEIEFESARKKGLDLVENHKEHRFIVHQTEISRGPVRKAQYQFGWDWGPILLTCGPWKPISMETYTIRLYDLHVSYELSSDLRVAKMKVSVKTEGKVAGITFQVKKDGSDKMLPSQRIDLESPQISASYEAVIDIEDIILWWPRGYGDQVMYNVGARAHLTSQNEPSDEPDQHIVSKRIGFRKTELVQEPDSHGRSFYFRINDVDVFCGGSCWIPADSFLTRLTSDDYFGWVRLAADGNQIMLRVWGGGIYEADAFYDAADELGILVWQDFMFACANYPTYPAFLESVEKEAVQNVRRLRHHPSVIVWAGNNEDYQIVERYGLEYNVKDKDPQSWLKTDFPARYIYEYLLPRTLSEELPGALYHPSSPFGDGKSTVQKVDPTIGDIHQWNVWHGTMEPYQRLPDMGGRFVSEFGMEAYPHVSTLEGCITREEDRYPGSTMMEFRNKAIGHERRLISYVAENFKLKYDLANYTHLTQVMQADAMSWAYKSWRRRWGQPGRRKCGGVLVWQLNDCWPTISWAVVDYKKIPKPAYYAMKRAMAPITVGIARKFKSWTMRPADDLWQRDTGHADPIEREEFVEYEVWACNSTNKTVSAMVDISYISINSGRAIDIPRQHRVTIKANSTAEILQDKRHDHDNRDGPYVIHVEMSIDGKHVASDVSWPDPIKYLSFPDRGVELQYSEDKKKVCLSAKRPVKGFVFAQTAGVVLSDNGFDIMPGGYVEVSVEGDAADQLEWKYVDM